MSVPPYATPVFSPLSGADAARLAEVARRFPPYSEFSLASLDAWEPELAPEVARLRDGVMLRLSDVQTGERFVTALGGAAAVGAIEDHGQAGRDPPLRLVPGVVADYLDRSRFVVAPERDHFDYVLDAAAVAGFEGRAFKHQRGRVNKLVREHAAEQVTVDLARLDPPAEICTLYQAWARAGDLDRIDTAKMQAELTALLRLLARRDRFRLVGTAIRIRGRLVALSLAEVVHDGYAMLHFSKALGRAVPGAGEALMQATARSLLSEGCRLINIQEDLRLAGLREAKLRYRPVGFLEKLRVTLRR